MKPNYTETKAVNAPLKNNESSLLRYTTGFILSIILTIVPYYIVTAEVVTGRVLAPLLLGFAVLQVMVQLVFFLHFGKGKSAYWNMMAFFNMLAVLVIFVAGSLWIMNNLNYHMMPSQMNEYMRKQNQKGF